MEKNISSIISLVEKMGYQKFIVPSIVEYEIYQDNQNYLDTNNIIKVIHPNGNLFALQADITMSICESYLKKNREELLPQKYYYFDEIFTNSKRYNKNIKNVLQFGLEYFCSSNILSDVEMLYLAYKSLNKMDENFVLEVSYSTILKVLITKLNLNTTHEKKVFKYLKSQNIYELKKYLNKLAIDPKRINLLVEITNIKGDPKECLKKMETFLKSEVELEDAYNYLNKLIVLLEKIGLLDRVSFDFSIINNMNYYNGIIFKGYVYNVAKCILNGGQI